MFHIENKQIMKLRIFALSFVALVGSVLTIGCKDDDDPQSTTTNYTATMNGSNEVPSNSSTATGSATASYNSETKILTTTVTYTGLTVTAAHIHKGAVGVSGNVIFPFTGALTSPINFTSAAALTAEQQSDLNAGLYYVNLHTAAFVNGEIRGQLVKQ